MHLVGLHVFGVHAVVADVRVSERDDLLAVAGVGQDFLVARHGGVEHHLTDRATSRTDGVADKDRAVCKRKNCGGKCSPERQKHWVLRMVYGYAPAMRQTTFENGSSGAAFGGIGWCCARGVLYCWKASHYSPRNLHKRQCECGLRITSSAAHAGFYISLNQCS